MLRHRPLIALAALAFAVPADAQSLYPFAVGASGDQEALSVALDGAGAAYVVGTFARTPDFDPGPGVTTLTSNGGFDVFVAKYDAAGALLWAYNIGGLATESVEGVAATSDGGVALTGRFSDTIDADPGAGETILTAIGGNDTFVAKFAPAGTLDWAFSIGGPGEDRGAGIGATADGGVVVTGAFGGVADFDPGSNTVILTPVSGEDLFVARYDGSGSLVPSFNGVGVLSVGGNGDDVALDVAVAPSGDLTLSGTFEDAVDFDPGPGDATRTATGDNTNGFVASYTGDGAFRWANALTSPDQNRAVDVAVAADGSVAVTGDLNEPTDFGGGLTVTPASTFDAFLARYDAAGATQWAFGVGGLSAGLGVGVAPDGDVVFTGRFNGSVGTNDFDPGAGVAALDGAGGTDVFTARYTAAGAFEWAYAASGPNDSSFEQGNALAVDGGGNSVVVGFFATEEGGQTVTFTFGGGATATLTSSGGNDVFVAKYDANGGLFSVAAEDDVPEGTMALSEPRPNPSREETRLALTLPSAEAVRVEVYDALGRQVATLHDGVLAAGMHPLTLNAGRLAPGVYAVRASGPSFALTRRLTVLD